MLTHLAPYRLVHSGAKFMNFTAQEIYFNLFKVMDVFVYVCLLFLQLKKIPSLIFVNDMKEGILIYCFFR